jgi:hypothetical protein
LTLRKNSLREWSTAAASSSASSENVIGRLYRVLRNSSRTCRAVRRSSTLPMVMKFFSDLDIFRPSMCRWPEWRK